MGTAMLSAAAWLSRVLAAENTALLALDIPAAAALLQEKLAAAHGLSLAVAEAGRASARQSLPQSSPQSSRGTPEAAGLALQLRDLAEENRRLLERAVLVQGRVLDMVARAACRNAAQATGRYGPSSAAVPERGAMALHLRA